VPTERDTRLACYSCRFRQDVGVLGAIGVLLVFIACWRSWSDRSVGAGAKMWNVLVLLACFGFVWFELYWNLLDFRRNY
jgi:hypothetical protein